MLVEHEALRDRGLRGERGRRRDDREHEPARDHERFAKKRSMRPAPPSAAPPASQPHPPARPLGVEVDVCAGEFGVSPTGAPGSGSRGSSLAGTQ
jgi:hypothetical protein